MDYKKLNKELTRVAKAVFKSMQEKAGAVGNDFKFKTHGVINIINMPGYSTYVDSGRRPGIMPPPSALKKWSRSKGLNEYAVAKSIKKNGIKAKKFLYVLEDIVDDKNMNKMADAAQDDTFRMIDNKLKTKGL